jgi:hypothetical protein
MPINPRRLAELPLNVGGGRLQEAHCELISRRGHQGQAFWWEIYLNVFPRGGDQLFTSNQSGRDEVHLRPCVGVGGTIAASTNGGKRKCGRATVVSCSTGRTIG